jgi:hypothetical protein
MIWVRIGDAGDYEDFDCLEDAVCYLNELDVGQVTRWRNAGVDTDNFWGNDYVSLYRGDAEGNLLSNLLPDERVLVEDNLELVLN